MQTYTQTCLHAYRPLHKDMHVNIHTRAGEIGYHMLGVSGGIGYHFCVVSGRYCISRFGMCRRVYMHMQLYTHMITYAHISKYERVKRFG